MSHWETSQGASDEWYTPKYIFDALGCTFDQDVASPFDASLTHVPAKSYIFANSLSGPWRGFVWMNPPFGGRDSLRPWLRKFFDHGNGVALTPDRTSAPWFQEAWQRADLALFMPKVKFIRPDGSLGKSPSNGTTLWAAGDQAVEALIRAQSLGILAKPRRTAA